MAHPEIDKIIQKYPDEVRLILQNIRKSLLNIDSQTTECMSYGVPAVELHGKKVLYSAFKNHIGIYPTPDVITHFKSKLVEYETAKGSIKFQLDKEIPYSLIVEIARYRFSLPK